VVPPLQAGDGVVQLRARLARPVLFRLEVQHRAPPLRPRPAGRTGPGAAPGTYDGGRPPPRQGRPPHFPRAAGQAEARALVLRFSSLPEPVPLPVPGPGNRARAGARARARGILENSEDSGPGRTVSTAPPPRRDAITDRAMSP